MRNWFKGLVCIFKGHDVIVGAACPVTGIKRLTCHNCGKDNMPKHDGKMSFN
jgi:hypothetical protein